MPIVRNVSELQNILKGWMQRPNESVEEWRKRLDDPANEISFDLFGLRDMVTEQIENERFEKAVPIDVMADHIMQVPDEKDADAIDVILAEANKKDDNDAG